MKFRFLLLHLCVTRFSDKEAAGDNEKKAGAQTPAFSGKREDNYRD